MRVLTFNHLCCVLQKPLPQKQQNGTSQRDEGVSLHYFITVTKDRKCEDAACGKWIFIQNKTPLLFTSNILKDN